MYLSKYVVYILIIMYMKLPRASRPGSGTRVPGSKVGPGPVGRTRVYNGSKTGQKWPIFDYFWGQNQPIFHNISNDIGTYYYLGSNRYSFNGIKAKENLQDIATIHQKILLSLVLRIWTRTRTRTRKFWTRNSLDPGPEKNDLIGRSKITPQKK